MTQLEEDGFLSRGHDPKLLRQRQLFEFWAMTYPQQLAPTLALQSFRAPGVDLMGSGEDAERGGENAVPDLIVPSSLTIYVKEFSPAMAIENRWRRDEHPNVFVRQKFWTIPMLVDPEGPKMASEAATVPSTLIYADLMASNEPRQREIAETFRNHDDRLLRISRS